MIESTQISDILNNSPSANLLKLKNRELVIVFFAGMFGDNRRAVLSDEIHTKLADYLEYKKTQSDEDGEAGLFDSYETKAKTYIQSWTNQGFLTNYQDDRGEIFYELSSHSGKTIDWLHSLKKEEYIGTESKFKNIFNQLKELVEFTNEDSGKRIQMLEERKLEIEQQINRIKTGDELKIFEKFEIVPRFNQLTQAAKGLLSDFKEVEDNFKEITKGLYQKHAGGSAKKKEMLAYTFGSLDELTESHQGKSFYAFWEFLLNPSLRAEWDRMTTELYETLERKEIAADDLFLKGMEKHLRAAGRKVYDANDKMVEKLSRIIRENSSAKADLTKETFQDIKKLLAEISKRHEMPEVSFELETDPDIEIHFDKNPTMKPSEEVKYKEIPKMADSNIAGAEGAAKLFRQFGIDNDAIRKKIKDVLRIKPQTTVSEVIEHFGGLSQGLPEMLAYLAVAKEFRHTVLPDKTKKILFDAENNKTIQVHEIILTR